MHSSSLIQLLTLIFGASLNLIAAVAEKEISVRMQQETKQN